jgi:hypothetical protein
MTTKFFSLLLRDTTHLLRPSFVVLSPDIHSGRSASPSGYLDESFLNSHPCSAALLALSDLSKLFENIRQPEQIDKPTKAYNPTALKLTFYSAHILSTPVAMFNVLADELMTRSRKIETESVPVMEKVEHKGTLTKKLPSSLSDGGIKPLIEDISEATP